MAAVLSRLDEVLRSATLGGRVITEAESALLQTTFGELAEPWLLEMLSRFPLVGERFELPEDRDLSGLGVEMLWMTPSQMVDEASDAFPGLLAVRAGYVPIGICELGSGDPYFLALAGQPDSMVVRIPHAAVNADATELLKSGVELVSRHLSDLLEVVAR